MQLVVAALDVQHIMTITQHCPAKQSTNPAVLGTQVIDEIALPTLLIAMFFGKQQENTFLLPFVLSLGQVVSLGVTLGDSQGARVLQG